MTHISESEIAPPLAATPRKEHSIPDDHFVQYFMRLTPSMSQFQSQFATHEFISVSTNLLIPLSPAKI